MVGKIIDIPIIDLSVKKRCMLNEMVKACEEFGFFKVINHGVSMDVVKKMEAVCLSFFSLPSREKHKAGPPNPLGYGIRNIGFTGDVGEVEYLLLHANNINSTSQRATSINYKKDHQNFSSAMNEYVEAVRELTCEILDMLGEGLGIADKKVFSRIVRQKDNDSLLRLNHYSADHPNDIHDHSNGIYCCSSNSCATAAAVCCCGDKDCVKMVQQQQNQQCMQSRVGFGEHSDPQILTLLRSNNAAGLQIRSTSRAETVLCDDSVWVPVSPDPNAFFVNVGDALEALTNGRLVSVRHRAMTNSYCARLSTVYFAAPPLHAWISPLPEMVTAHRPRLYRSFTWGEYKKAMYSLKLGYHRLILFRLYPGDDQPA